MPWRDVVVESEQNLDASNTGHWARREKRSCKNTRNGNKKVVVVRNRLEKLSVRTDDAEEDHVIMKRT